MAWDDNRVDIDNPTDADGDVKVEVAGPVDADGNVQTAVLNDSNAIALGLVTGQSHVNKWGTALDFDTGDGEVTVWDGSEDAHTWQLMNYVYSATADIDSISSDNAGDTVDIEVQGLDASFNLVTQTITLTGQTRAALSTDLIRVFRAKNVGATDLAGHVFIYVNGAITGGIPDTANTIRAVIHSEANQTEMAIYTVPDSKTGLIQSLFVATAGAKRSSNYIIRMKVRPTGQVFQLKTRVSIEDGGSSFVRLPFDPPLKVDGRCDIEVTAEITETAITAAAITAGFDIVLVDD